jgi:IS5 family transposase
MRHRPLGLFDQDTRQRKLEALGDPLVVLNKIVPWEMFRERLEATRPGDRDPRRGGRPGYDAVLMFKILVLRELYALSDEQVEFQVADRLSFQRFLGIGIEHSVPDYTAVWRFRERLKGEAITGLFGTLGHYIDLAGFEAKKGQILDASLVSKPRTRKPGRPKDGEPALSVQQAAHRDTDASWTKKHGRSYFGYKNHVNADVEHGFIREYAVTPAAFHDSQCIPELLATVQKGQPLYGDSAYRSANTSERCALFGMKDRTHYKASRNRPLTAQQRAWNKARAKVRARVEHVFARIDLFRRGKPLRCTGLARAKVCMGLINLAHNLRRLMTMHRRARAMR